MKIGLYLLSTICTIFLAGCLSAGAKNTVVYTPSIAAANTDNAMPVNWHLRINSPRTSDFLDSTRVAVRRENQLQVFEGVRWADSAPNLLQSSLLQHFNASGKITSVSELNSSASSDAVLLLDLQQFEAVYTNNDRNAAAVISVHASLQLQKTNRIIASKPFLVQIPAETKKIPQVMTAFDSALQKLSQDILLWTLAAEVPMKK